MSSSVGPEQDRIHLQQILRVAPRAMLFLMPYAISAAIAFEVSLRMRTVFLFKIPFVTLALVLAGVAVLLGAHVAAARVLASRSIAVAPGDHQALALRRLAGESLRAAAVLALGALASVGALDVLRGMDTDIAHADWPISLLRWIGMITLTAFTLILIGAAIAFARSADGTLETMADGMARLARQIRSGTALLAATLAAGLLGLALSELVASSLGYGASPAVTTASKAVGAFLACSVAALGAVAMADLPAQRRRAMA